MVKGLGWELVKAPERLTDRGAAELAEAQHANRGLYRAYRFKEELRALYHLDDPTTAPAHLEG